MNVLFKGYFGSTLYGMKTVDSDTDIRGVYLPTKEEYLLQTVKDSITLDTNKSGKNTADDVDEKYYSLNKFVKLLLKGDFGAWDMLHCPDNLTMETSPIWEELKGLRKELVHKDMTNTNRFLQAIIKSDTLDVTQAAHAMRWGYQMIQLHTKLDIKWPLPQHQTDLLLKVKAKVFDKPLVTKLAENLDKELQSAYTNSFLPEQPRMSAKEVTEWLLGTLNLELTRGDL